MDESDVIVSSVEIIKDKLYFATLKGNYKPKSTKNTKYFTTAKSVIMYENFFFDYGPYHLCHLYLFCTTLNDFSRTLPDRKLVFYSSDNKVQRLNAAYLIGCYSIIFLKKWPTEIFDLITKGNWELLTFRDASGGYHLFEISLLDVFEGLHKAFRSGFFDFDHFNGAEYLHYERVLNGDLNWIIPEKMLAFSGPHAQSKIKNGYPLHAPSHYHKYFKENNVTAIVRLNQKTYSSKQFTDFGFEHYELFFVDGSVPSDLIVERFNLICEKTKGAVAVHCKAGLGRTGTLIACYLMKHHQFTARQAISWLRICRPGSVIGFQQNYLIGIQDKMLMAGVQYRLKHHISEIPKFKNGIYSNSKFKLNPEDVENANFGESSFNDSNLDDLENMPSITEEIQKLEREDSLISPKQNKDEFVSLDSIIDSKKLEPVVTRSMTTKTRASTALASAKNAYTANKSNYMSNSNNGKPTTVKVQTTYTPKKLQTPSSSLGSSPKSGNFSFAKGTMTHSIKVALTKSQYAKGNLPSQRANLARNHNQGYSISHSAGPLKTFAKKTTNNIKTTTSNQENANKTSNSVHCRFRHCKEFDANLNVTGNTSKNLNENISQKDNFDIEKGNIDDYRNRKKIILRKKPTKPSSSTDQINDFKNCNISNSDSELDSNGTALTNMSADSLENIPCKMATRRDKSRTLESTKRMDHDLNNETDTLDGLDPQGSRLCHIKATRKKVTRNYTNLGFIKKK